MSLQPGLGIEMLCPLTIVNQPRLRFAPIGQRYYVTDARYPVFGKEAAFDNMK